jgi:hypothetical protein
MQVEGGRCSPCESSEGQERGSKRRRVSTQPTREVGLMRRIPGDEFSGFVGSASGIYFIRSVYGAMRQSQPTAPPLVDAPRTTIVPGEDDQLSLVHSNSSERVWRSHEVTSGPVSTVSFQELVDWTGSFFANWHPYYPFIFAPDMLGYFEQISLADLTAYEDTEDLNMIMLRSIMSISLADHRQSAGSRPKTYPVNLVFSTYNLAVGSLRCVLAHPTSIATLQAAVSVQLFLVSMLRLNAASRVGGLVNRMAVQLGLHRCAARFPSFSNKERETRLRLFWTIYTMDRFICQSMGLPLGLHDDDIDVCYPGTEHHIGSTNSGTSFQISVDASGSLQYRS